MKRKLLLATLCVVVGFGYLKAADLPTSGSGEFFIKNVGTGTYLKGDAYYGTKAVVWNDPYAVTLTYVSEGVYTIKSQQNNGGENQYFGSAADFYVDQGASNMTFTEVDTDNHYYTIANATGNLYATQVTEDGAPLYKVMAGEVSTDYAKWQIVSRAELEAALDGASDSNPVDATFFIKDAGIDVKSVNAVSWSLTNVDLGGGGNAGHSAESWNKSSFNMSQTVTGLPNGKYKATCYGYYRWNNGSTNDNAAAVSGHASGDEVLNAIFFAGTKETLLQSVAGDADATTFCQTMEWDNNTPNNQWQAAACFTQGFYLNTIEDIVVTDGTLTIGVKKTTQAGTDWAVFDEFKLYYLGEDLSIYEDAYNEALTAAQAVDQDAPMLGTALSALQDAISTYGSVDTSDKDALLTATSALSTATVNANTSIDAYAAAATKLTAMKEEVDATNVYTEDAYNEYYGQWQTKYDAATLTNEEAAALQNPSVVTGWHASVTVDNFLLSAWDTNPDFVDAPYYINTWSTEGGSDGSNFTVPFFEYWTGDGNSLGEKTLTATMTGLPNGLYKVSAWVRVRAKNETAATDATGITLDVNNGTAVDVTEGEQIGTSQFNIKKYTAEGLVKDGNLYIHFNVAADNNISWLSFKNVKYTKDRDLTEEEAAVLPTAIALDETEATIYKGNTLTLTPTFTPEDATETVTWTSDNEDVATVVNGVVTAVAYGTANITVTSTLDEEVSATCAVTVTAPLITEAANLDFSEGPVMTDGITIRTYAKDKIDSDVSGMQEVSGWTIVSNGDAKASGIVAYGSSIGLGAASSCYAPATDPNGNEGNVLGIVGVWTGSVQYTQNVKLPVGAYTITVPVYMTKVTNSNALAKNLIGVILDDGTEYLASTTTYNNGAWKTETITFTITEETYGKLSLGLNSPNKGSADCQRLYIDGITIAYEPFATAEDYAALNEAIADAETEAATKTLGFQTGEYAPYVNAAAITALATAKAIDQESNNAQSAVQTATTALTSAVWTANEEEVNAIYDGTFAAATNNGAPAGWTMSNNTLGGDYHSRAFVGDERLTEFNETNSGLFLRFDGTNSNRGSMYYYGNTEGYTMPLKADTYYRVTVDFAGWGSTGKPLRLNVTGPEGFTAVGQQYNTSVRADNADDAPQQFNIVFQTADAGNYVINFQTPGADSNTHNVVVSNIELFTEPETNVTMAVSSAKYGTFIAPFDVEIPEGVTASTVGSAEEDGTTLVLTNIETGTIPANTPVILYSESVVNKEVSGYSIAIQDSYTTGLLTGVYAATPAPAGSYVLQNNNDKVGFYVVEDGKEPTVGANRAYLKDPESGAKPRAFFFNADDATAIATIAAMTAGEVEGIYTIGGAKVQSLQKGVNILKMKNGQTRKVIVK